MGEVLPLPNRGEVFLDPRGQGRSLRVSWHRQENTLVLSLWQLGQCRATFRLYTEDVPDLVRALVAGLSDGLLQQREAVRQLAATPAEPPTVPLVAAPATVAGDTAPAPTVAKPDAREPGVTEKERKDNAGEKPPAVPPVIFKAPPDQA